jgi:hypothetical protein
MKRILIVALAAIVSVFGLSAPAEAKPVPKPTAWHAIAKVKPRWLTGQPSQIWITVQGSDVAMGNAAYHSAAFMNGYTKTKFNCSWSLAKVGPVCLDVPCPTNGSCLQIRSGDLPDGMGAKYEPLFCAGSCMRAGRITIDKDVPPYGGIHPWGPYERALVMEHQFTRFIGLAENQLCLSVTDVRYRCNGDSVPNVLTPTEAAYAAAW